jgi:hypothetical protein
MNLNPKTIAILKNFSTINLSIVIKEGNVLSTMSTNKTIMAHATVPDEFPKTIGIYNLNRFLSAASLLNNPNFDFGNNSVTISDENQSLIYHYSEPSMIVSPPNKEIKLPSVDAHFILTNKNIQSVLKALNILGLPEIAIVGDGTNILLQASDIKNTGSDGFSIVMGDSQNVFRAVFRPDYLKIIEGEYDVKISSKGISQFTGVEATYFIAIESSSTF